MRNRFRYYGTEGTALGVAVPRHYRRIAHEVRYLADELSDITAMLYE